MFSIFKKQKKGICEDHEIVAIADAIQIPLENVKDEMFAQKMLGDGVAFELREGTLCAPANGTLCMLYPSGHAFGITMKNGVNLLCHIGINTVEAHGEGFQLFVKQGDQVCAGDPILHVDIERLTNSYDLTTMLIVTDTNYKKVLFQESKDVRKGEIIARVK